MAVSEVTTQRATVTGNGLTVSITWPATPVSGNLMVVYISIRSQLGAVPTVVPTGWVLATSVGSGNLGAMYYKVAGASEPITAAWTLAVSNYYAAVGSNWSGLTATPLDKVASVVTGTTNTPSLTVPALTQSQELVVVGYASLNGYSFSAFNALQVEVGEIANGSTIDAAMASVGVASTVSVAYNAAMSGSGQAILCAATFKLPAGGIVLSGSTNLTTAVAPVMTAPATALLTGALFRQKWGALEAAKITLQNSIAAKTKLLSEQSVDVLNPCFENDQAFWTATTWATTGFSITVASDSTSGVVAISGTHVLTYYNLAGPQNIVNSGHFRCSQGKRVSCSMGFFRNYFSATIQPEIWFYDKDGNFISKDGQSVGTTTLANLAWSTIKSVAVAPANTAYCCAALNVVSYTTGVGYFDKVVLELDSISTDPINNANLGSRWTPSNMISYSCPASGTTQTVSIAAGTLTMGDQTVNYNAGSVTVTQARSTTVLYYIYYYDPTFTGGTKAINISTNGDDLVASNGNVFVGTVNVTVPASTITGTGVGDPGAACVDVSMYVSEGLQAGRVQARSLLECSLEDRESQHTQMLPVLHNTMKIQPCFRIVSESGAAVVASESTPMTLRDGTVSYMPLMLGQEVLVKDDDGVRWERVVSCDPVRGHRPVAFISVSDNCYFAGELANKRIATHNVAYKP